MDKKLIEFDDYYNNINKFIIHLSKKYPCLWQAKSKQNQSNNKQLILFDEITSSFGNWLITYQDLFDGSKNTLSKTI